MWPTRLNIGATGSVLGVIGEAQTSEDREEAEEEAEYTDLCAKSAANLDTQQCSASTDLTNPTPAIP